MESFMENWRRPDSEEHTYRSYNLYQGTVQLDLVIFQQTSNLCSKENRCFRNTFKPDTAKFTDATKIEIFPYVHGVIHV